MTQEKNIIGIVSVVGLIILAIVVAVNRPEINVNPSGQNTLSVSGNAELTVSPDQAEAYLNIMTDGKTAKEAQDKNTKETNSVMSALKNMGIKDSQIETSGYYLNKKTEWDPDLGKSVDTGYTAIHTLKVTTEDIEEVGKIVDNAVNAGANGVERISFGLTKETEKKTRDEALKSAAKSAEEKAKSIASTTKIKLGKISAIQESNFYYQPFEYNAYGVAEKALTLEEDTIISPQKVDVRSTISIAYEIG